MTTERNLLEVGHSQDPLGVAAYKQKHHIYTLRMDRQWTAFISDQPLPSHIGLTGALNITGPAAQAATEIKALNRLAKSQCLPTYEQWKYQEVQRAATDH